MQTHMASQQRLRRGGRGRSRDADADADEDEDEDEDDLAAWKPVKAVVAQTEKNRGR